MPQSKLRVVGSGFTTLDYDGIPIAWLESFQDSGQRPIVDPQPITPIGDTFPREIVSARALGAGTLGITIRELWNSWAWQQLGSPDPTNPSGPLASSYNILDVYQALSASAKALQVTMLIKPPTSQTWRGKAFLGCWITDINDGEQVSIAELSIARNITLMYTHTKPIVVAANAQIPVIAQ